MNSLNDVCGFLTAYDNFAVLMHSSPDGDTIGSATALCLALKKLNKNVMLLCADQIDKKYQYMLSYTDNQEFSAEHIISVDVADEKLLGTLCDRFQGKIELNIDHHGSNKLYAKINYVNADSAANCENIYDIINSLGVEIDQNIASCLYTGISTDTGCFLYPNTTSRTLRITADLLDKGALAAEINRAIFETKTRSYLNIQKKVIESLEYTCDNKVTMAVITLPMQEEITQSDIEIITALPRQIEGTLIGITLKQKEENRFKVSVRTFPPISACDICEQFGGGGHNAAAGCEIIGSLDEVKAKLIDACKKELEK